MTIDNFHSHLMFAGALALTAATYITKAGEWRQRLALLLVVLALGAIATLGKAPFAGLASTGLLMCGFFGNYLLKHIEPPEQPQEQQ